MNEPDVPIILRDMPTTVRGFCCLGSDYEPCIVINSRLPQEMQIETYKHERGHISRGEMFDEGYVEYE